MFESLGNRFSNAFASLRSRGKLSSSDIANVCQEIRQALLDADVALSVVEDFTGKIEVEAKAALTNLQAGANQAQVVFEIVNQALVELLGNQARRVRLAKVAPTVIMLTGLQGAGKTTLMRMLTGELQPNAGKFVTGVTVKAAFLTQHLHELDPTWRVLEAVEKIANHVELGNGKSLSASQLCERLGFDRDSQWTPVGDLSGGEKRRLQLTRLLMDSPNVLLLDEPTNDFDIETLTELEDLLDSYGGTLIVVSHDRYFLERVCDRFVGLLGDGALRDLPRGVDQYLEQRLDALSNNKTQSTNKGTSSAAEQRQLKKDVARLEKQLAKLDESISALVEEQSSAAFDAQRIIEITAKLEELRADKNTKEEEWLFATTALDS
jgi:ATP-binding cassette subfamily F protein uup